MKIDLFKTNGSSPPSQSSRLATSSITPRLLTVKQASVYVGCTIWAIRELYWSKEVAGFIAGRRLLIERQSLDAYITRRLSERGVQ